MGLLPCTLPAPQGGYGRPHTSPALIPSHAYPCPCTAGLACIAVLYIPLVPPPAPAPPPTPTPQPHPSTAADVVPSGTFRTADGKWVVIGGNGDSVYSRLMEAIGRPDMGSSNPRYANNSMRCRHEAEIMAEVGGDREGGGGECGRGRCCRHCSACHAQA